MFWDVMSWILFAATLTLWHWYSVGDFNQVYWIPRLSQAKWMITIRYMKKGWLLAYFLLAFAGYAVWYSNGGFDGCGTLLALILIIGLLSALWSFSLFFGHQIQGSFYFLLLSTIFSVISFGLAVHKKSVVGSIFLFLYFLYSAYVSLWTWSLAQCNMSNGRVRAYGVRTDITFQSETNSGIPVPKTWRCVDRRSPYDSLYAKVARKTASVTAEVKKEEA